MAYQSGDTILDDHYNDFVGSANTIWGSGSGNSGWGQTSTLSTVSAGSTITATQWVNLLNRCSTMANHQGLTLSSITNPTTGDTISAYTNLNTNLTDLTSHRGDCAAVGTSITASGTRTGTNTWYTSQACTLDVSFSSSTTMRYFFNAGGRVGINFSRSGGTSNNKNTGWTNLLASVGTLYMTTGTLSQDIAGTTYTGFNKVGGSGTDSVLATTTGEGDLTTTPVLVYRKYDSTYSYTSNYIEIYASKPSTSTIRFSVTLYDVAADTTTLPDGSASNLDQVDGTLSGSIFASPPGTTYISNTWGTPTLSTTAWSGS